MMDPLGAACNQVIRIAIVIKSDACFFMELDELARL